MGKRATGARGVANARKNAVAVAVAAGLSCFGTQALAAEPAGPQTVEDLRGLSLDQLADLEVTSVSRRPQTLSQAPAALYVITSQDIRRSGFTTLPEVLRLAPNLEVAKINAYSWTVTARGFNSPETANKLLVLVDGRSVYEPVGAGVLWQQVDVALDTIDRIEVISGPGGTLWGANAVNGVINIITKNASDTQGLYLRAARGVYRQNVTARFGGKLGDNASYRVFVDTFKSGSTRAALASDTTRDSIQGAQTGFAIDGKAGKATYSLKGDAYRNAIIDHGGIFSGYNLVGSWTQTLNNGSVVAVQAYVDHNIRDEPTLYESRDTINIDAQHSLSLGDRHQFVWGGEVRQWQDSFTSYNIFHFANPKSTISLGSVFAQDEIALHPDLKLTLGLKAETNSYSGFDWLPNVRLAWQANPDTLLWGAVSRAVRTPNRIERELEAAPYLIPSPDFGSEKLTAIEAGWRAQPKSNLWLSLSAFYNIYDDLRTDAYPATIFPLMLANGGRGTTYGVEGWGKIDVTPNWRLNAGFNVLHKEFKLKPGQNDLTNLAVGGQDPEYQAQLRSEWNVSPTVEFDIAVRTVGKVTTAPVPAYTEASIRTSWRITDAVELSLIGSNLLNPRHLEVWDPSTASPRYSGRSIMASIRYGF